jgi:hypothetical protein
MTHKSSVQHEIFLELCKGAVIGELSDKIGGRYELFIRKTGWRPITGHHFEHPFIVKRLNKNTFFSLLENGIIEENNSCAENMLPFGRDKWYIRKTGESL